MRFPVDHMGIGPEELNRFRRHVFLWQTGHVRRIDIHQSYIFILRLD
jgi:hypothetical protein